MNSRLAPVTLMLLGFASASLPAQRIDSTTALVDRAFDAFRDTEGPGCAVGVGRSGRVVYERGYGMANLETGTPIRPSSIFHVASVSKQFTAAAIMLLERDGKLSVDDDIRKFVPEIPSYGKPITIRHLMTHTSGLRDQWDLLALARGRFEENRITEADVMDIMPRQTALNFDPGAEYVYSNTGFTLMGVIIKRVSGKSLREFADERIFKPLGMNSTHFHDDYTMVVPGRTSAYSPANANGQRWRVSIPNYDTYGATSLFTTVGDLLKWQANFDTPVVGDAAMLARMQERTVLTNGDTSNYGFGITNATYRGARVVEHGGADAGYRSHLARFPQHDLSVAIACNTSSVNATQLARRVADAYLGPALAATPVQQQAAPVPVERLARRVGTYMDPVTMLVVQLIMRDGRLMVAPNGAVLIPLDENRFALPGQAGDLIFDEGENAGYQRRFPNQQPLRFLRKTPVAPTAPLLARYQGEYVSAELGGAVYRVTVKDSTLMFATGTSQPFPARLVFADTFLGNGYTIQFSRAGSNVTGFDVTNGRIRHVRFRKNP